jgi:DNA-binding protein YbaB
VDDGDDGMLATALRLADQARTGVASLTGRGRSPDGSVRARVGGDGLLEAVRLRPAAMGLDPERLAGQLCAAVRAAQESYARRASELRSGMLGTAAPAPDPLALAERLEQAQAGFARRIEEFGHALEALHRRLDSS